MYQFSNLFWIKKTIWLFLGLAFALVFIFLWSYEASESAAETEEPAEEVLLAEEVEQDSNVFEVTGAPFSIDLTDEDLATESAATVSGGAAYRYNLAENDATITVAPVGFETGVVERDFTWTNSVSADGSVSLVRTPTEVCLDPTLPLCSAGNGVLNIVVEPDSEGNGVFVVISDPVLDETQALEAYEDIVESIVLDQEAL